MHCKISSDFLPNIKSSTTNVLKTGTLMSFSGGLFGLHFWPDDILIGLSSHSNFNKNVLMSHQAVGLFLYSYFLTNNNNHNQNECHLNNFRRTNSCFRYFFSVTLANWLWKTEWIRCSATYMLNAYMLYVIKSSAQK